MSDWHIPTAVLRDSGAEESELLLRALEQIEERTRASGAAASHQLEALVRSSTPTRPVSFAGFTERSALQRMLAPALCDPASNMPRGAAYRARAADPTEELELAAHWCRAKLSADPQSRLLVVVPELARHRAEAQRLWGEALEPQSLLGSAARGVAVEGGESLSRFPLVHHALTTLRLLTGALEFETLSGWLRSAFWRAPSEAERAHLDIWLRLRLGIELSAVELSAALEAAPAALRAASEPLRAALQAALRMLEVAGEPADDAAPIVRWVQCFAAALEALGWPGARPLDSGELQTHARLTELLADVVALGVHTGPVTATAALSLLEALADRTVFAPATGDAAVTLTSVLADPVVRYDGIWVAGLHADAWPPPPQIDPFIPFAAQRRAGIPGVTALGMLARARDLLGRWQRSAAELIVSCPARDDDREYLVSPLLAELPHVQVWAPAQAPMRAAQTIRATRRVESFEDPAGAPWPLGLPLPAGARALEYQGRCPFRAYAELRLSSAALETPRPGLDPRERGRFLHRALELMWGRLKDSSALAAAQRAGALEPLVAQCVAQAAEETWPVRCASAESARRRERTRAARLLCQFAALEETRADFRVSALETPARLELAGARLDLRIDRIDELEDGSRIIIDYKTSRPSAPDWLAERISDPQLLAYLLAEGEPAVAFATAHLTGGRITYRGLSDRAGRLPHVAPLGPESTWQAQRVRWRAGLERLARGFLSGAAVVHPVEHACRICHLHALCRIGDPDRSPVPEPARAEAADADRT